AADKRLARSGPYIGAHFIFRVGALRGDRLPCRGSSHTSDPPRASSHFCIHPAHGRGSHFGTGLDLGASRTSLFGSTDLLSGRMPSSRASLIQREAASSQCPNAVQVLGPDCIATAFLGAVAIILWR